MCTILPFMFLPLSRDFGFPAEKLSKWGKPEVKTWRIGERSSGSWLFEWKGVDRTGSGVHADGFPGPERAAGRACETRDGSILGESFVGAYLVGGFALGGGDLQSDCDFVVVTEGRVMAEQERELRELHGEIPTRPGHWPHDLEGSYAPRADLETLAALDRQWLYVDRGGGRCSGRPTATPKMCAGRCASAGSRSPARTHVSWSPRFPQTLFAAGCRPLIESFLPDLLSWTSFDIAWAQRYAVTTLCRMLYTLETGEVASKPACARVGQIDAARLRGTT